MNSDNTQLTKKNKQKNQIFHPLYFFFSWRQTLHYLRSKDYLQFPHKNTIINVNLYQQHCNEIK